MMIQGPSDRIAEALVSPAYPDLVRLNARRTLVELLGAALLDGVAAALRDALGTAATIFEANGDYASGARPVGWCAAMDALSRPEVAEAEAVAAVRDDRWPCRHDCREPARRCLESETSVDLPCRGGLRVRAVPIRTPDGGVVGVLSVGYGPPPLEREVLVQLGRRLSISPGRLQVEAQRARLGSPLTLLDEATLEIVARLLGVLVQRARDGRRQQRGEELLVGMAAHDLRSPLTALLAGLAVLERVDDPARRREVAERMRRSTEAAERLIGELLDVTRVKVGGGIPLERRPVRLDEICREAVDEVVSAHPDAKVELEVTAVELVADPGRLREVVTNLALNGVKHGDGGALRVRLTAEPEVTRLSFTNDDRSIPPELLEALFDPFAPEHQERRRRLGLRGLGLGMFIAREIVRAHGGELEVRSNEEVGTEVMVTLPRSQA